MAYTKMNFTKPERSNCHKRDRTIEKGQQALRKIEGKIGSGKEEME